MTASSLAAPGLGMVADNFALDVRGLCVDFVRRGGALRAVDGIDFQLRRGSTLGLVGESGSGKTVTSMAIAGLLDQRAANITGSIKVMGREIVGTPERELSNVRGRHVGMIFQEPRQSLNPAFTVGEQIAEVYRIKQGLGRRAAAQAALAMLDVVEIPNAAKRYRSYPHEFSGGMCQRVMLALAIANRPDVLIADEPTTALDITVQARILALLVSLQAEFELALLFITHDLGIVDNVCDDVLVLYAGQVVEQGSTTHVFEEPLHPYTAGLLAALPENAVEAGRFLPIPGIVPGLGSWPHGCRFGPRCQFFQPGRCDVAPIQLSGAGERAHRCVRADELRGAPT